MDDPKRIGMSIDVKPHAYDPAVSPELFDGVPAVVHIEEIYGALNGVLGILEEELIDLAAESQQQIRALRHTPGAAPERIGHPAGGNRDRLLRRFFSW